MVQVIYKRVKNANLKVKPNGEVILTVPFRVSEKEVASILEKRADWITEKLNYFKSLPSQIVNYVNGETVPFLGKNYTLNIIESDKEHVTKHDGHITLYVQNIHDRAKKKNTLDNWYKDQAHNYYTQAIEKYIGFINKPIKSLTIRRMKTRWGSCNQKKGYINLSLELVKKSIPAIEYVVLHELTHLLHYYHDKKFYDCMSLYMPDWKARKAMLIARVID